MKIGKHKYKRGGSKLKKVELIKEVLNLYLSGDMD